MVCHQNHFTLYSAQYCFDDIEPLAARQQQLLHALWPLLKPGGRLLYATCSLLKAENQNVVAAFMNEHADAALIEPDRSLAALAAQTDGPGLQLFPGPANTDGFYYALMEKRA